MTIVGKVGIEIAVKIWLVVIVLRFKLNFFGVLTSNSNFSEAVSTLCLPQTFVN